MAGRGGNHPSPSDEDLKRVVEAVRRHGSQRAATDELKMTKSTVGYQMKLAARRGFCLDEPPAMPGFEISKVTTNPKGGQHVTQRPEAGPAFEMPPTHALGKVTYQVGPDGRIERHWPRAMPDEVARQAAQEAAVAALCEKLPRAAPAKLLPLARNEDLLAQYTVTDLHFGSLSWREETGDDYDLKIAEQLLLDWFEMAIRLAPDAQIGVLAQLGDLLHFDGFKAVTPEHGHVLDADSRFQKIVRVVIRTLRKIVAMMLAKHERVHIIMADANHDPASGAWLREMFAAFYDDEPRVTVEQSAGTYYVLEHGQTSLFYHHGHRKKQKQVDTVFAGKYREIYGRTKFSYAHMGHLHSDEVITTNLMKVERHETLAGASSYEANGGWISGGRSAKVIMYSRRFGWVGNIVITEEMVAASREERLAA